MYFMPSLHHKHACALLISSMTGLAWSASPVLYVSRLPLENRSTALADLKEQDLQFYCVAGHGADANPSDRLPQVDACKDRRLMATQGDTLTVLYVTRQLGECGAPPDDVELSVAEKSRKTAFSEGLSKVLKFIADKDAKAMVPTAQLKVCYHPMSYVLQEVRADAKVSVTLAKGEKGKLEAQYMTGPEENWFLSADAVVRGARELKYDTASKSVQQRDKPEQAYLGINYMVGDLYRPYKPMALERTVFKLMLSPSRRPFDAYGIGVGYRFAEGFKLTGDAPQPTGGFIVFVGSFWTRDQQTDANGVTTSQGRTQSWRVGVSYGLDTLFDWLK